MPDRSQPDQPVYWPGEAICKARSGPEVRTELGSIQLQSSICCSARNQLREAQRPARKFGTVKLQSPPFLRAISRLESPAASKDISWLRSGSWPTSRTLFGEGLHCLSSSTTCRGLASGRNASASLS